MDVEADDSGLAQAVLVRALIEEAFYRRGGTAEQWARVSADPRKFYVCWRRLLGLAETAVVPPPHYWTVDPISGRDVSRWSFGGYWRFGYVRKKR